MFYKFTNALGLSDDAGRVLKSVVVVTGVQVVFVGGMYLVATLLTKGGEK